MAKAKCEELVRLVLIPLIAELKGLNPDTIQFGKTKVFLRKNAYDILEMLHSRGLVEASIIIQASARVRTYARVFVFMMYYETEMSAMGFVCCLLEIT